MYHESILLGFPYAAVGNATTLAHTTNGAGAANIYSAFGFVALGKTLDKIRIYCSAAANLTSIVCEIRPEKSTGGPDTNGTALATATKSTGLPSGAGWVEFSGINAALTAGLQYYAVLYNNSSGASPSITYQYWVSLGATAHLGGSGVSGFSKIHGTDGVTFATSGAAQVAGIGIVYSDGTRQGLPLQSFTADTTSRIYDTTEAGAKFTLPRHADYLLSSAGLFFGAKTNSPTGNVTLRVYQDQSLIYQSGTVLDASLLSGRLAFGPLPIRLRAGNTYRIVAASSGGNATNYNKLDYYLLDSGNTPYQSMELRDFQLCQNVAGTWTDTPGKIPIVCLALDPITPFIPVPLNRRQINSLR